MAQPSYDIKLQVEDENGVGNWIEAPNNIYRQPGQTANYRLYYMFTSTTTGIFNNINIYIKFEQTSENINDIVNIMLPDGAKVTKKLDNTGLAVYFMLGSNLLQNSGLYIYFTITSTTPGGPDGVVITSRSSMSGSFHEQDSGIDYSMGINKTGPSWVVRAEPVNILIEKKCDKKIVLPGTKITYTITITNNSAKAYKNPVITDILPHEIINQEYSIDGGNTWANWIGNCNIPDILSGDIFEILIRGDVRVRI